MKGAEHGCAYADRRTRQAFFVDRSTSLEGRGTVLCFLTLRARSKLMYPAEYEVEARGCISLDHWQVGVDKEGVALVGLVH
jgi:hypothetical protein